MPELPEVQALTVGLSSRMAGRNALRCELASFSALKTVSPSLEELIGWPGRAGALSPFKRTGSLDRSEVDRLHDALVGVLTDAVGRASDLDPSELKGDKKRAMQVHGRTGKPCPVCGDTIRQVSYATTSLQYCPTCQTRRKKLADRRLFRLLK